MQWTFEIWNQDRISDSLFHVPSLMYSTWKFIFKLVIREEFNDIYIYK